MKKLILTLAVVSAAAIAAPVAAQNSGYRYNDQSGSQYDRNSGSRYDRGDDNPGLARSADDGISGRIANLDARLQAGIESGAIDRGEARNLRTQMRDLLRLEGQYSANGLTDVERRQLQDRIRYLRQQLRTADGGAYDRFDQDDRFGNGYNGRGGPYEEVSEACMQPQAGLRGVLGSIMGADNCLRVGERVNMYSSLAAVPADYGSQFRDSGNVYHRWVDGRVVQIDGRTRTVTRIYDVSR